LENIESERKGKCISSDGHCKILVQEGKTHLPSAGDNNPIPK